VVTASWTPVKNVTMEIIWTATDVKPIAPFPPHQHVNPAAVTESWTKAKSATTETMSTATDATPTALYPDVVMALLNKVKNATTATPTTMMDAETTAHSLDAVMASWTPVKNVTTETTSMVMDAKLIALSVFARRQRSTIPVQGLLPFNTNTAMLNPCGTISSVSIRVRHP
jgi:hypothetical protein